MKLKNSNEKLSLKKLFPVMYAGVLVLSVLRIFQLTRFIDSETGFFTGGSILNVLFYVIIAAICLFFVSVSFLSAEGGRIDLVGVKDKGAGIASAVFALSLVYDWLDSIIESIVIFDSMSVDVLAGGAEGFKLLMSSGALPYALQSFFALLSAIYVLILAKSFLKGTAAAHKHKFLALMPIAWTAFKLITRFVKQISYIRVSDLFLELIMLAFMILFFVALSQVVSGVYCDDSRWRITGLGLSGALMALCINVPRLVLTLFASEFVNKEYPFSFADTMFALFAIFVAVAASESALQKSDEE